LADIDPAHPVDDHVHNQLLSTRLPWMARPRGSTGNDSDRRARSTISGAVQATSLMLIRGFKDTTDERGPGRPHHHRTDRRPPAPPLVNRFTSPPGDAKPMDADSRLRSRRWRRHAAGTAPPAPNKAP